MWTLIVFNTLVGSLVAVPGYTSQQTCLAGGQTVVKSFVTLHANTFSFICTKVA